MELEAYKNGLKTSDCRNLLLEIQMSYKWYQAQKEVWSEFYISKEGVFF